MEMFDLKTKSLLAVLFPPPSSLAPFFFLLLHNPPFSCLTHHTVYHGSSYFLFWFFFSEKGGGDEEVGGSMNQSINDIVFGVKLHTKHRTRLFPKSTIHPFSRVLQTPRRSSPPPHPPFFKFHSATKPTIPLPPPAIISPKPTLPIRGRPVLIRVRERDGIAIDLARGREHHVRQLAGDADGLAGGRGGFVDAPDFGLGGVVQDDVEGVVRARVDAWFGLLVLGYVHAAGAGGVAS